MSTVSEVKRILLGLVWTCCNCKRSVDLRDVFRVHFGDPPHDPKIYHMCRHCFSNVTGMKQHYTRPR